MKKWLAIGMMLTLLLLNGTCLAQEKAEDAEPRILVAYFSLWGNADYAPNVDATSSASIVWQGTEKKGTTEVAADWILNALGGEKFLIQAEESYPTEFQSVVDRNHEEAAQHALPALLGSVEDMEQIDVVFLGYPIWNMTVPRAVQTFLSSYDFSGKTIIPFCTHDGYGSGRSYSDIADACPDATVLEGIAIEATEILEAKDAVDAWLNRLELPAESTETPMLVSLNGITLEAVLYDTPEAEQFKAMLPLTVSMWNYGGRELYGSLSGDIAPISQGQLFFSDGDITYCEQNNTVAIFYAQSTRPNLTMEVIPMGRVTSDLNVLVELDEDAEITFSLPQ